MDGWLGGFIAAVENTLSAMSRAGRALVEPSRLRPREKDDPQSSASRRTHLVVLVIDPHVVHAYWEVAPARLSEAYAEIGGGSVRPVLRFFEVPGGGWFDVEANLESRNCYVSLWSPGRTYFVELGLADEEGQFVPLARSSQFSTPRAWPVAAVEERFERMDAHPPAVTQPPIVAEPRPPGSGSGAPAPAPPDSQATLARKIAELHAFRGSQPEPEAPPAAAPPPASATAPAADPTALAEGSFDPGISS